MDTSREPVSENDRLLTKDSSSTRVVSNSDATGTSLTTTIVAFGTSGLTDDSSDSGAPQAKRLRLHCRQQIGFDTLRYARYPWLRRKACCKLCTKYKKLP